MTKRSDVTFHLKREWDLQRRGRFRVAWKRYVSVMRIILKSDITPEDKVRACHEALDAFTGDRFFDPSTYLTDECNHYNKV